MLNNKKIIVVMPAYNAEKTLEKTVLEIDRTIVDEVIVVDDFSSDNTIMVCKKMGLPYIAHEQNKGYGANQKSCYAEAIKYGADIIIMIHPDYQYDPKIAPALAGMLAYGVYDLVLASRIIGNGAIKGGMPIYKYIANRGLTFIQNILCNEKLSEYHTGYRAFTREVLETLPLENNSDDFVFDNEMLGQAIVNDFKIGEVSCPTRYSEESSSINLLRSIKYGLGVLSVSVKVFIHRTGLFQCTLFAHKK